MANEFLGRAFTLKKGSTSGTGGTTIAACKSKSIKINNTPIDVTTDDSAGIRQLLDAPGIKSVDIEASGIASSTDTTLLTLALHASVLTDEFTLTFGAKKLYGKFFLAATGIEGGDSNAAATFSLTLNSAGLVTLV